MRIKTDGRGSGWGSGKALRMELKRRERRGGSMRAQPFPFSTKSCSGASRFDLAGEVRMLDDPRTPNLVGIHPRSLKCLI